MACAQTYRAIGLSQFYEVRTFHAHMRVVPIIENVLPLPHHSKEVVVHHDDLQVGAILHSRSQFLCRNLESAIAYKCNHLPVRECELCPQGRRESITHRAQTA